MMGTEETRNVNKFDMDDVDNILSVLTFREYFITKSKSVVMIWIKKLNTMDEKKMFCYQCQETAKGSGCTLRGVCGKLPETSMYMDLLLAVVRAVGVVRHALRQQGVEFCGETRHYICDALFSTITNANFDDESILRRVERGLELRNRLVAIAEGRMPLADGRRVKAELPDVPELRWSGSRESYEDEAMKMGVLRTDDENVRSLKELTMYGLKGMAAYYEQADRLGYSDDGIIDFMAEALTKISDRNASMHELISLVMKTGEWGVKTMALLDKANTSAYGAPVATEVCLGVRQNPGILISGHDLLDLEDLLKQSVGQGVDIYTHGEMLPAHYYPKLKMYKHLVGNYGNSWWQQREEFERFNGPIIFTTNCIVPPSAKASYSTRVFTLNSTGYPGWRHIPVGDDGHKDFSEVIRLAKRCAPPEPIEMGKIIGGFAHNQVEQLADKIVEAVKSGAIRKFVVMAGCDGRMKSREYYTEFARSLPEDCVILTAGCAKYRYNKLQLGDVCGIPRVLDAGQCNDSYSLAVVAMRLKEAFELDDVNKLPIYYNIAWYEQKAVIVLLSLLSLGVKNIHLGPSLPAFLSPSVLKVLVEKFGIAGIGTVEEDLAKI